MLYNGSMNFAKLGKRPEEHPLSENRFVKHRHTFYGHCIRDARVSVVINSPQYERRKVKNV